MSDLKLDVRDWLPHTPPMLMLSEVSAYTGKSIDGLSRIRADNPLLEDGRFPCLGAVELFAQLAGILFAIKNTHQQASPAEKMSSTKPSRGAVVQLKSFELGEASIPVGSELKIHADFIGGSEQAAKMSGVVYFRKKKIFEGSLMIALFAAQTT